MKSDTLCFPDAPIKNYLKLFTKLAELQIEQLIGEKSRITLSMNHGKEQ